MESKFALLVQLNGVFLITLLSVFLRRSLKLTALKYWTTAWLSQSFALICLRLAFDYQDLNMLLFSYYFLGEYIFGFMLVAGCKSLYGKYELNSRIELLIIPFVVAAIFLPLVAGDFNDVFHIHELILSGFYFAAYFVLGRVSENSYGRQILHVTTLLSGIGFSSYFVLTVFSNVLYSAADILPYHALVNLVLQTAMGFGMVIALLEKLLFEARTENVELREAKRELEELAHTDPLTRAFNRHAFYGFVKNKEGDAISGCVGFFDIDNLKGINDCYGHEAGDIAIRAVVRSIREIVRAEDLIYRWGGDEFFVIMVSMDAEAAETRMARLDGMLDAVMLPNITETVRIGVSWGFTNFADIEHLEKAIEAADIEMLRRKQNRKVPPPGRMGVGYFPDLPNGLPRYQE